MTFAQVLNAGIRDDQPSYLQKKIRIANSVALIISFGVAVPFIIISGIHFPPLVLVPIIGVIISLGVVGLNALNKTTSARLIISLLPLMLAAAYNVGLASVGEPPVTGLYMIELGFSITVFLVFDLREKRYLISLVIIVLLIIFSFPYTQHWWEPNVDATIIREGYVGVIAVLTSILYTFGSVFILAQQNFFSENKFAQLLTEAKETNETAKQSEQELKESLKQLEEAQEEEKQRQWVTEGLTQTVSILRENDDLPSMSEKIVSHIIRYINANQGGLFIVDEQDSEKYLRLQACYAYGRKKFKKKTVAIGEGLLGQAYLEKEYSYLTEIPQNYVNITSGLGKATPRALLIMPLIINEEVEGVLELASLQEFKPHEIEFMQTLGESIAATLRNARISTQTKALLEESQQQAEEMQAQEEEMRQNMEEMQATQEQSERLRTELEESENLLKEKLKELEAAQRETEEVRRVEQQRTEEQIKSRKKMMEKAMQKFKEREQELLAQLEAAKK
ncbi:GAF domain-containing protein [Tunicatimonas pelagia]|uniref:GAF domain-containing protein n=1 Tax=Tunicatimonas pelagia TaxID=931531 RepID=UPI002665482A|nr:GAF domain-containing protein [Tunicatimonas pelagia]WKN45130.1 GAF domain-containing protein [Tunicatimonas pelagia]